MKHNLLLASAIKERFTDAIPVRLGINKSNEITRLAYEICIAQGVSPDHLLDKIGLPDPECEKGGVFHRVKQELLSLRYPGISAGDRVRIMPLKVDEKSRECPVWKGSLEPLKIFVENQAAGLKWTQDLLGKFPEADIRQIDDVGSVLKRPSRQLGAREYDLRRENLFIVKNKRPYIKKCPCTKLASRCGYWILDLGFGCPFDCSYCYLQTYSNIPGIVLTANVDDYYEQIMSFDASLKNRVRIGTGEFTDSLALDRYTGYSAKLIGFFRNTEKLVLELKTKTSDIDNVLSQKPHDNVVISWSINTPGIAEKYEKGSAGVDDRIDAAFRASERGFRLAFHFDPVVWYDGWEKEYSDIIARLFSKKNIREKTAWISLGTLRYTPGLKQAAEQRFDDNLIFYEGDFFLDFDEKFRYPSNKRNEIYDKMKKMIRQHGVSCWIYLCMEPAGFVKGTGNECHKTTSCF